MKWLVIWICACHYQMEVIYAGLTEESARSYATALWRDERTKGSYFIAYMDADRIGHDPIVIWNPSEATK